LTRARSAWTALRKFTRFSMIYGPGRSLFKAAGRFRVDLPLPTLKRTRQDIGMLGCGQFAFSTMGYFLHRAFGPRIAACHDPDVRARDSFARARKVSVRCDSADALLARPELRTVYIASNHASHASYAAAALARGLDVYVEKPIAVTHAQLVDLLAARQRSSGRLFAGYNRPFSGAIRDLRKELRVDRAGGITLQCFVSGHQLGPDHWYRRPEEGTRVCGNIGHWLDLAVHMFRWRGLPDVLDISIAWASNEEPDDNVSIAITSDKADVVSIVLTSRCEPFEGINETISFQHADTICKIDDFRSMTLWQGPRLVRRRYWPKDVGHRRAILQPYEADAPRDWHEVELSTLLMLHITDMVRDRQRTSRFSFADQWKRVSNDIAAQTT